MRLSEAIRLGAMLRPQAKGRLFHEGGSCAIGAAYEALGLVKKLDDNLDTGCGVSRLMPTVYPWLTSLYRGCPHDEKCAEWSLSTAHTFHALIPHLNDDHSWTREQIADWVEQQEQKLEQEEKEREQQKVASAVPVAVGAVGVSSEAV